MMSLYTYGFDAVVKVRATVKLSERVADGGVKVLRCGEQGRSAGHGRRAGAGVGNNSWIWVVASLDLGQQGAELFVHFPVLLLALTSVVRIFLTFCTTLHAFFLFPAVVVGVRY